MSRAWDLLNTSNLLLLAPRRVGKSSLLNRMREDGPINNFKTVYLSVPDAENEIDFIKRLVRALRDADWARGGWVSALREKLPHNLEIIVKTSLLELKAKNFDWRGPAEELENVLSSGDAETLLLVDELPLLVGNIAQEDPSGARVHRFLLWLKRLREQYRPRWFFAGSIGLDSVARQLRLSGTIHDLQPLELGEFSPEKARAYLIGRAQFHGWNLTSDTIDAILRAVEWAIPFYLNLLFEELREVVSEKRDQPSPALVELAVQKLIAHGRTHFDHWDERLYKMLDSRAQHLSEIVLSSVCNDPSGVSIFSLDLRISHELNNTDERTEMLRRLLDLLISDGYLVRRGEKVQFRSALLRRYWREVQA